MDSPEKIVSKIVDKIYYGQNMERFFAIHLLDETVPRIVGYYPGDVPLVADIQKYFEERERILQDLKQNNHDPDPKIGSVHANYKIARKRAFPNDGDLLRWQREHIYASTPTDVAFELCLKQVKTWWEKR